jgi:hypothetical protein
MSLRVMIGLGLAALSLAACGGAKRGDEAPAGSAASVISLDTLKGITQRLSSDEFEGREPGTPGEAKTLALLVERFQAAGLKPGNNGSWFQDVPLVELTARNVTPLTFTGGRQPLSFAYGPQMVVGTNRVTPRIDVKDSEVVFVGYGINAPERGWNDYAGVDVKGKTVVILINDPDWETQGLEGPFGGRAMTYYGRWTYKYEEAAKQGAAAALIVHQTEPAAYGWNVVQSSWSGPQQVADAANGHMDQTLANGWIGLDQAKALFASGGQDLDRLAAAAKTRASAPSRSAASRHRSASTWPVRKHASKNVIGILPGTTPGRRICALHRALGSSRALRQGAGRRRHLQRRDRQCDRHGRLVALAAANAKAGPTPRTQVYLAVTAEESGLLGSAITAPTRSSRTPDRRRRQYRRDAARPAGAQRRSWSARANRSSTAFSSARSPRRAASPRRSDAGEGLLLSLGPFQLSKQGVPMLYFDGGDDLVQGGKAAGQAYAAITRRTAITAPPMSSTRLGNWSGALRDAQILLSGRRALARATPGRTGLPATNSRASAIVRAPSSAARMSLRQPPEWRSQMGSGSDFPSHADLWLEDLEPAREGGGRVLPRR